MNKPPYQKGPQTGGYQKGGSSGAPRSAPSGKLLLAFKKGLEAQPELMDIAQSFAQELVNGRIQVKHHQLRLLLDLAIRVKQSHKETRDQLLSTSSKGRLAVMRPRLAYMAARERGLISLQLELDLLLKDKDAFKIGADLDRLYEFVAAVVAYHRYEESNKSAH
ncbi:MAG: type III-A CRISPR-associated protein Csm2 [Candidatus Obscuribacterales bacterium]|nr:type III-A CRISPR-associated protein Csm2 [Candidatus Obscuribacterales bacterium]